MKLNRCKTIGFLLCVLLCGRIAQGDIIETKDGAKLVGTVKAINAGTITFDTSYAGTLTIKQSSVASIATSQADSVRLASGSRIDGTITTTPTGQVEIVGKDGALTTTVEKVAMLWPAGSKDPLAGAWAFEATANIQGSSGNTHSIDTGGGFKAVWTAPHDTLKFYGNYDRAVTNGLQSANQLRAGVDYSDVFDGDNQWFVRDEAGFDRLLDERYEDIAAAGYGFDLVKTPTDLLVGRVGVAYRYDDYYNPVTPTISSVGGDVEIAHDFKGRLFEVSNSITFVPTFSDFSNFIVHHDSYVQVPLSNTMLKFRAGITNDYNSKPGPGISKMDTLYYLRLVYDFGTAP
ncbi:MAG TPA: DUF481 domain-containing protein [Opitutaceae bacterium]|jgi:putative salt-induced outer membrane protein YdiY